MREHQQLKDALVTSKLDAITLEYNYLLTTQLDSQRLYFEGLLAQQEARYQQQVAAAKAAAEQEAAAHEAVAASAREVEKKRQQLERKLVRGSLFSSCRDSMSVHMHRHNFRIRYKCSLWHSSR